MKPKEKRANKTKQREQVKQNEESERNKMKREHPKKNEIEVGSIAFRTNRYIDQLNTAVPTNTGIHEWFLRNVGYMTFSCCRFIAAILLQGYSRCCLVAGTVGRQFRVCSMIHATIYRQSIIPPSFQKHGGKK